MLLLNPYARLQIQKQVHTIYFSIWNTFQLVWVYDNLTSPRWQFFDWQITLDARSLKTLPIIFLYWSISPYRVYYTFLIIWTTSSSSSVCSFPTLCGLCFALEPQTKANLNCFTISLWMRSQKSSTVHLFADKMTGSS